MKTLLQRTRDFVIVALILAVFLYGFWLDSNLQTVVYSVKAPEAPASFNGFKIAQISDLHDHEVGENNETLINMLREAEPDIIVFTGDMVDGRSEDFTVMLNLADEAIKIAPCYYVSGNHEVSNKDYAVLHACLTVRGVNILDNEVKTLEINGEKVNLIGVKDPTQYHEYYNDDNREAMKATLSELVPSTGYNILLSHRPELFDVYAEAGIDLAITGHTHGGQIRIPGIGGVYSNDQGLFPAYDRGLFTKDGVTMIVNPGIADTKSIARFYNPPEISVIELVTVE